MAKNVWVRTSQVGESVFEQGVIVKVLSQTDSRSTGQIEVNIDGKIWTVPENLVFDHKPVKTVCEDEFGTYTQYI